VCHVLDHLDHRLAAVARTVLQLMADFAEGAAVPGPLDRRQVPVLVARHAGNLLGVEVLRAVAGGAAHRCGAETILATHDQWLMQLHAIALQRAVAAGVAVQAARVLDHFASFGKHGQRTAARRLDAFFGYAAATPEDRGSWPTAPSP